jgi:hypothetical protein
MAHRRVLEMFEGGESGVRNEYWFDKNDPRRRSLDQDLVLAAATAQTATSGIVNAANTLLSTPDDKPRQRVLFAFSDEKQRSIGWCQPQRIEYGAAFCCPSFGFVRTQPHRGFEKVQQIMEGDEANQIKQGTTQALAKASAERKPLEDQSQQQNENERNTFDAQKRTD